MRMPKGIGEASRKRLRDCCNDAMHVLNHRTHLPPLLRREVAAQLHAGYKCEIEALGEAGGDNMIEFICHQMQQCTPVLGFDGM